MHKPLEKLGWNKAYENLVASHVNEQSTIARVLSILPNFFLVGDGKTEWLCTVAGKLKQTVDEMFPVAGDWVMVENTVIVTILPRKNTLSRAEAGTKSSRKAERKAREQAIAANLDSVFIVCGLDQDFNLRRLERALALIYNCKLSPVIVLTKADLHESTDWHFQKTVEIAPGVPVIVSSKFDGRGLSDLASYIPKGQTVAMLGTSGAGKSTLANLLYGSEIQQAGAISESVGKGRHTTTRRQLIIMPQGGVLMDSPGIREIAFSKSGKGLKYVFSDIETLAEECRFADCTHSHEPDCAIIHAIEDGKLDAERFESYSKMKEEMATLAPKSSRKSRLRRR